MQEVMQSTSEARPVAGHQSGRWSSLVVVVPLGYMAEVAASDSFQRAVVDHHYVSSPMSHLQLAS
jgi:hypothetical protein